MSSMGLVRWLLVPWLDRTNTAIKVEDKVEDKAVGPGLMQMHARISIVISQHHKGAFTHI